LRDGNVVLVLTQTFPKSFHRLKLFFQRHALDFECGGHGINGSGIFCFGNHKLAFPDLPLIDIPPTLKSLYIGGAQFKPFVALGLFDGEPPMPVGFDTGRIIGLDFVDSRPFVG
jgi:hypothetical protein